MKLLVYIAHKEAEQMLKTDEDRQFLIDERGMRMKMAGIDQQLTKKEEKH